MKLEDYPVRICVAGSRTINDKASFDRIMRAIIALFPINSICFISGAAKHGPDRMIIDFANYYNYPVFEFPADWDNLGKKAGFVRNAEMRKVLNRLVVLWDGKSKGTKEMIEGTKKIPNVPIDLFILKTDGERLGRKSKSG